MPSKREIEIFKFEELTDRAKQKARDWYLQHGLDYEWWDSVYDDADRSGLKITSFDTGRGSSIKGKFTSDAEDVAKKILKDHGNQTDTYKDAKSFLADWDKAREAYYAADEDNEDFEGSDEAGELEKEFLHTLLQDYLTILRKEEEYLTSDEAVDESIIANDYEFYEDGSRAR